MYLGQPVPVIDSAGWLLPRILEHAAAESHFKGKREERASPEYPGGRGRVPHNKNETIQGPRVMLHMTRGISQPGPNRLGLSTSWGSPQMLLFSGVPGGPGTAGQFVPVSSHPASGFIEASGVRRGHWD